MKKLLTILATFTLTTTPITAVVSCASKDEKEDENKGTDPTDFLSINDLLANDIIKNPNQIFGSNEEIMEKFMNLFAYQLTIGGKYEEILNPKEKDNTKPNINTNDFLYEKVKTNINDIKNRVDQAWKDKTKDASDGDKEAQKSLLKEFQETYGRDTGDNKFTSYDQYEDVFKQNYVLNNQGTDGSVLDKILKLVVGDTSNYATLETKNVVNDFNNNIYKSEINVNNKEYDFKSLTSAKAKKELFKTFATDMKDFGKTTENQSNEFYKMYVNLINATGGETTPTSYDDQNKVIDAATINLVNPGDDLPSIEDRLDFKTDVVGIKQEYWEKYDTTKANMPLLDTNNKTYTAAGTNLKDAPGLLSNGQRKVANDFFETEKPVAVTELVVAPLTANTGGDYSKDINNRGYVGGDTAGTQAMQDLTKFLNIFINKDYGTETEGITDLTMQPEENSSDYSWDQILMQGTTDLNQLTSVKNVFSSDFSGKVTKKDHSKLLTIDSTDYDDLAKYAIYDFIGNGGDAYKWGTDSTNGLHDTDIDPSKDFTNETDTKNAEGITSFIHSMDRSNKKTKAKADNNIYQVVNAEQGIISYMDKDGIHFLRIEGYKALTDSTKSKAKELNVSINNKDAQKEFLAYNRVKNFATNKNAPAGSLNKDLTNYQKAILATDDSLNINYKDLNSGLSNNYLQFLANASLLNEINFEGTKKYSFKLSDSLNDFTKTTKPDSIKDINYEWLTLWNYFKDLEGMTDKQFFNFMFDDESADNKSFEYSDNDDSEEIDLNLPLKSYVMKLISITNRNVTPDKRINAMNTKWEKYAEDQSKLDKTNWWAPTNSWTTDEVKEVTGHLSGDKDLWKTSSSSEENKIKYNISNDSKFILDREDK